MPTIDKLLPVRNNLSIMSDALLLVSDKASLVIALLSIAGDKPALLSDKGALPGDKRLRVGESCQGINNGSSGSCINKKRPSQPNGTASVITC